jgi:hypothetical protein
MARLDTDRQKELEPQRMQYARKAIESLGYTIAFESETEIRFRFEGAIVKLFPYSGWHTGSTIIDGRGIEKLLKQIKKQS